MDRRQFLALATGTLTGLVLPAAGLLAVPRALVLHVAGTCSFCRRTAPAIRSLAGRAGRVVRICAACVDSACSSLHLPGPRPPTPAVRPIGKTPWREQLVRAGYPPDYVDALRASEGAAPSRPSRTCGHCEVRQTPSHVLLAGAGGCLCGACVLDAATLLAWSAP